jgi:hypothetical protein
MLRATLTAKEADFKDTLFPQIYRDAGPSGGPPHLCLGYDDGASNEEAHWQLSGHDYEGGDLTVDIYWYAANATSGVVRWGVRLAAYTAETDSSDVESKAYATADEQADTHLGTTSKRVMKTSHTISSTELDSMAAGDLSWLGIYRDSSDSGDTMSNDAIFERAEVSEAA